MSLMDKLVEKLPTEKQTADYLRKLEERTGLKAERSAQTAERLAERAVGMLKGLESRADRLERFTARVNDHVEGKEHESLPSAEGETGAATGG